MVLYLRSLGVVVGENSDSLWGTNETHYWVLNGRKRVSKLIGDIQTPSKCHRIVALENKQDCARFCQIFV